MRTPKHFANSRTFSRYIHTVAIRDLEALICAHQPAYGSEPDELTKKVIEDTKAEIRAIRARMKRFS